MTSQIENSQQLLTPSSVELAAGKQPWTKPTLTALSLGDAEASKKQKAKEHFNMKGVQVGPSS